MIGGMDLGVLWSELEILQSRVRDLEDELYVLREELEEGRAL